MADTKKAVQAKTSGKKSHKGMKKNKVKAGKELGKIKRTIRGKSRHWFKGRFGQRPLRRDSIAKWQKWRYPHSIDANFKKEDGPMPCTGFRTPKEIRFRHPSGFLENIVNNMHELQQCVQEKHTAVRIASTVGKRKRIEMIEQANKLGLKVLN